jgi:serine O-acetyltransferase
MNLRWRPARWVTSKLYGLLQIFSEIVTGISIDRSMQLPGKGLHIIHPTSVYIHPGVKLGERVGIMHNVTLGTNMRGNATPEIGNDVFIGTGASILGKVKIGDGARIAANSLVVNNVPPGGFAVGVPAKTIMMPSVRQQEKRRGSASLKSRRRQAGHRKSLKQTDVGT